MADADSLIDFEDIAPRKTVTFALPEDVTESASGVSESAASFDSVAEECFDMDTSDD